MRQFPATIMRREVLAWSCYERAKSSCKTWITVFVVYLQGFVFAEPTWNNKEELVGAWGVAGAVLLPTVNVLRDSHGSADKRARNDAQASSDPYMSH